MFQFSADNDVNVFVYIHSTEFEKTLVFLDISEENELMGG